MSFRSWTKPVVVLSGIAIAIAIGSLFYTKHQLQKRVEELEPKEQLLHEICATVKSALWLDRSLLKNEKLRDHMIDAFGGPQLGDGFVMLQWCLSTKFPMGAWDECRASRNYECLGALLQRAEDSITF